MILSNFENLQNRFVLKIPVASGYILSAPHISSIVYLLTLWHLKASCETDYQCRIQESSLKYVQNVSFLFKTRAQHSSILRDARIGGRN